MPEQSSSSPEYNELDIKHEEAKHIAWLAGFAQTSFDNSLDASKDAAEHALDHVEDLARSLMRRDPELGISIFQELREVGPPAGMTRLNLASHNSKEAIDPELRQTALQELASFDWPEQGHHA